VPATFTVADLSQVSHSLVIGDASALQDRPLSICTDSRQASANHIYLALKGERFDGHDFVKAAAQAGAPAAIISFGAKNAVLASLHGGGETLPTPIVLFAAPDSLLAYHQLARQYRQRINPKVIAVTGSSGKTTTKEMCAAVFSSRRYFKSALNENNEIGVPKTILAMPEETEFLILEMGMRGLGQIAELADCARPDIGIITSVGVAHIELLGSRQNIAIAKCELLQYLDQDTGTAILGQPDGLLVEQAHLDFKGKIVPFPQSQFKIVDSTVDSTSFTFVQGELSGHVYNVHAHGSVLLQDAWCALQAGVAAGLTKEEAAGGLAQWRAVEGRGNAVATASGALIVDESYNSNPDSVRCAVEALLSNAAFPQAKKIIVLGEMLELGEFSQDLHQELGEWLKDKPLTMLLTVGPQAALIASGAAGARFEILPLKDLAEAQQSLKQLMHENTCIMIKGSHGTKLYELVGNLLYAQDEALLSAPQPQ